MVKIIFWVSVSLVVYSCAVYPLVLFLLAGLAQSWRDLRFLLGRADRRVKPVHQPAVTLLIPAYNEERVIEAKLRNALALDYPRDKLEVIVVSDGSTDRTNEIVTRVGQGVKLIVQPARSGKAAGLNRGIAEATGEVVVITDANALLDPAAVRQSARHFADARVGVVLGDLKCASPKGYEAEGRYWDYERVLKFFENRIGGVLGGQGGIYAIRRACYRPIPSETWTDDFVIGMRIREAGFRIVYDVEAAAVEETTPSVEAEFVRKARIAAGDFQSLAFTWRLLNPLRGPVAFAFWSHKVLRWLMPFFLLTAFAANLFLLRHPLYRITFGVQAALYGAGIAGRFAGGRPGLFRLPALLYYFLSMNAALLVGFFRCVTGRQRATWQRVER